MQEIVRRAAQRLPWCLPTWILALTAVSCQGPTVYDPELERFVAWGRWEEFGRYPIRTQDGGEAQVLVNIRQATGAFPPGVMVQIRLEAMAAGVPSRFEHDARFRRGVQGARLVDGGVEVSGQ